MLKKTITFKSVDGDTLTEDFYFNLNIDELMDLEESVEGGLAERMQQIADATGENKGLEVMNIFRKIIVMSVGERVDNGRRFDKRDGQVGKEFLQTDAFNRLFLELVTNAQNGADFINALIPAELFEEMKKALEESKKTEDVQLPPDEEPVWVKENREPTQQELQSMTQEQLLDAFARKNKASNPEITQS